MSTALKSEINFGSDLSSSTEMDHLRASVVQKIKEISLHHFKSFCRLQEVTLVDQISAEDLGFDHWIVLIMIDFPGIKVQFRVHFSSAIARVLTGSILGTSVENVDAETCHSVISEYCNLTGIGFKNHFVSAIKDYFPAKITPLCTLPGKSPSFDQVEKVYQQASSPHFWKINWPQGQLCCSATVSLSEIELVGAFTCDTITLQKAIDSITLEDVDTLQFF